MCLKTSFDALAIVRESNWYGILVSFSDRRRCQRSRFYPCYIQGYTFRGSWPSNTHQTHICLFFVKAPSFEAREAHRYWTTDSASSALSWCQKQYPGEKKEGNWVLPFCSNRLWFSLFTNLEITFFLCIPLITIEAQMFTLHSVGVKYLFRDEPNMLQILLGPQLGCYTARCTYVRTYVKILISFFSLLLLYSASKVVQFVCGWNGELETN